MNNENENELQNKETKWSKRQKRSIRIPKGAKFIIFLAVLLGIFYLGIIYSSVFTTRNKNY